MKKFAYKIEGTDGTVIATGTSDNANSDTAFELVAHHNPTDDSVTGSERDPNGNGWEFSVQVSNSDDYYVTFEAP